MSRCNLLKQVLGGLGSFGPISIGTNGTFRDFLAWGVMGHLAHFRKVLMVPFVTSWGWVGHLGPWGHFRKVLMVPFVTSWGVMGHLGHFRKVPKKT